MPARAIHPEDKLRKRESILDAAQYLWVTQTNRLSSMDALAQTSGVAKGTLYLYFRSKEEVLLALHERDMAQFFERMMARAQQAEPMQAEDLAKLVIDAINSSPTFLPLSSVCMGLMERHIPQETAIAFKEGIHQRLNAALQAVNHHFPTLTLLNMLQAYALILGLWQLLQQNSLDQDLKLPSTYCGYLINEENFLQVLHDSLLTLFKGLLVSPEFTE
ncbi:TetR/AcrR family transcriptional regulator [Thiothrix eikelboomii]|uniref:TetR/AcrR family transcriptional regulator n=1 Tax=Thiothrix eikelboomii TaxID=92487 RepID=UPI003BB0D5C1